MSTSRLLVVCTANVCRSPATALLLRRRLAQAGAGVPVALATAGTAPRPGAPCCPVAAGMVAPDGDAGLAGHASRAVTREDVEAASLVLVMERAHRAVVARTCPTASPRTFTLREAAHLAGTVRAGAGEATDLPSLVAAMHAARGASPLPRPARSLTDRLRRRPGPDPYDVPDAHVDRVSHEQVVAALVDAVDRWVVAVSGTGPAR